MTSEYSRFNIIRTAISRIVSLGEVVVESPQLLVQNTRITSNFDIP